MISSPCWKIGGICINYKLCTGFRSLTEVPGCKDKLKVCCFAWNKFNVREWKHEGINTLAMPWSYRPEFGGKGIIVEDKKVEEKKPYKPDFRTSLRSEENDAETIAIILRTNK